MSRLKYVVFLLIFTQSIIAADIITVRSPSSFNVSFQKINELILDNEYQISVVQRCDYGLKESGYKTDEYRIVSFGSYEDVKAISDAHLSLSVFLPLRIALVAERNETVLSMMNPAIFLETVKDKKLVAIVQRWIKDSQRIMMEMRK